MTEPLIRVGEGALPQNMEAEQAVLGSCLIDPIRTTDAVLDILKPHDFYLPADQYIFQAMADLRSAGEPADVLTVADALERRDSIDVIGGSAYLASLAAIVPTPMNAAHYAAIVKRTSVLRQLIDAGGKIASIGYDEALDPDVALERAGHVLEAIGDAARPGDGLLPVDVGPTIERIEQIRDRGNAVVGTPFGIIDLDRMTGGMERGHLTVLAARPSMGKSSLALTVAYHNAIRERRAVAIFSPEMSRDMVNQRLLALDTAIDAYSIRTGQMADDEWEKVQYAKDRLNNGLIWVDDTPSVPVMTLRTRALREHERRNFCLVVVDYLQLVTALSRDRLQEVSMVSRMLKDLARELDAPVLALAQLSREVERRADHRPVLSDLRETGQIEQDSDIVLMLYRDKVYDENTSEPNVAEIWVRKQRNGPRGMVRCYFDEKTMRFADMAYRDDR